MSFDVSLEKHGVPAPVRKHAEGGTHALGGSELAELNVTYNYSEVFALFGFSLWDLDRRTASNTQYQLQFLVERLGTKRYKADYWAPTPGNAGHALHILLCWAQEYPDAVWRVS